MMRIRGHGAQWYETHLGGMLTLERPMHFEIVGEITDIETIAVGSGIREITRLRKLYGGTRWRKMKGVALVRLPYGGLRLAELHWYEAHGVGRMEVKRKRYLE